MVELLKQPQYQPYPIAEQIVSIFAGTSGLLDSLPVASVSRFESEMLEHFRTQHGDVLEELTRTGELPDALAERMRQVLRDFKTQFKA